MELSRAVCFIFFVITFCPDGHCQRKKDPTGVFGFYKVVAIDLSNCTNQTMDKTFLAVNKTLDKKGNIKLKVFLHVLSDIGSINGKFRVFTETNGKEKQVMNVNIPNFCEFLMKDFATKKTLSGNQKCALKTGVYEASEVDVTKYVRFLLGSKFFYGKYGAQLQMFSLSERLICMDVHGILDNARGAKPTI